MCQQLSCSQLDIVVICKSVAHRLWMAAQVQGCYDPGPLRLFMACTVQGQAYLCASAEMSICEAMGSHTGAST